MSLSSGSNRVSREKNHLFQGLFPIQTCYLRNWDEHGEEEEREKKEIKKEKGMEQDE